MAVAEKAEPGANILCMLPDTGERYLSTPLFEDIPADMTSDEEEISHSTPNYRFDTPPPVVEEEGEEEEEEEADDAPASALDFLDKATHDPDNPVVLFALEWCEFCWSVRKMFSKYEIPYRSIDLDSVAYQKDNLGGDIRAAILERTGLRTIPQIYIGGKHIGGATELFDAAKDGSMAELLEKSDITWNRSEDTDPYSFLPGWLQSR
jgi:cysteine synthase A